MQQRRHALISPRTEYALHASCRWKGIPQHYYRGQATDLQQSALISGIQAPLFPHDSQRAGSGDWPAGSVTLSGLFQWSLPTLSDASGLPAALPALFSGTSGSPGPVEPPVAAMPISFLGQEKN